MSVLLLLIGVLAAGIVLRRSRAGGVLLIAAGCGLFLWGWSPAAAWFSGTLERRFQSGALPSCGAGAIVVLSGNVYPPDATQHETLPGYSTYLRCHHAALVYRNCKRPVVVSGGPVENRGVLVNSTTPMRRQLEDEGVPAGDIWVEDQSLSTAENAAHTAALLRSRNIQTVLLVTEGFHMLRAVKSFERQGLIVTPAPCAFRSARFEGDWREFLSIRPENMVVNEANLHEWAGLLWYRLSGKL